MNYSALAHALKVVNNKVRITNSVCFEILERRTDEIDFPKCNIPKRVSETKLSIALPFEALISLITAHVKFYFLKYLGPKSSFRKVNYVFSMFFKPFLE